MERSRSNAGNLTFNRTVDAATRPTPADMPRERTTDVVNPDVQTITPENGGELGEVGVDEQDLTVVNMTFRQVAIELCEYVRAGFRARAPYLNANLHKYQEANSTNLESKECCCICLDEYSEGEEIAKIDCGHLYHVGCIREWINRKDTCPICKRRVSVPSVDSLRIRSYLVQRAATNQHSFGPAN
ncbi:RING finger protein 24 [Datura stramonium]|uniref:RING-type E3 ubiquitin transferase n=1 Tax=Datura stramonium TaxID=4076 RepID=A0ABS8SQK0_DATST|nr:RING finger protein 24 [Datura stramonium]